jgi:predicted outer membrane repeat protein
MVDDPTAGSVVGKCTIVDAVTAVNTQTAANGCAPGDGNNDTIDLTGFTVPTAITFTQSMSGLGHTLSLSQPATISGALDGSGAPLVTLERSSVSGTPDFGLILTTAGLTLYGVALSNGSAQGYSGGAVLTGSPLTVDHCVISGNTSDSGGGGIAAGDGVTLTHSVVSGNSAMYTGGGVLASGLHIYYSTISGNSTSLESGAGGGGIYSSGPILARYSTVSGNTSAAKGGGMYTKGILTMTDSTFSGNTALGGAGGGVFAINSGIDASASTFSDNSAATEGGGIYASDALLTNSTVTGNTAVSSGGGVYASAVTMSYCTVFANTTQDGIGGGVDFGSSATSNGSILYGNSPDDLNTGSQDTLDGSSNLIGLSGWGIPADTISCNPMLGPLGDFGGPTMTLPLMSGSCALYAASSTPSETTDQRGYPRPAVGEDRLKADIGAFERQPSDDPDLIFANGFE